MSSSHSCHLQRTSIHASIQPSTNASSIYICSHPSESYLSYACFHPWIATINHLPTTVKLLCIPYGIWFIFILCSLVFCLHVCLYKGSRSPETVVTNSFEMPCGYRELNLGLLEQQPVLLTTEPSLHIPLWSLNLLFCIIITLLLWLSKTQLQAWWHLPSIS